jgi:NAD(P)-dependent dehydrogenase (short-subunit alcohol dehydrogenase family)
MAGIGRLEGRVAVVTGGARGLGRAIAERFAAEGARVAVWDRDHERASAVVEALGRTAGAVAVGVDVADSTGVDAAAERTRVALGPVDTLVNNAGVAEALPPWEVTDERWRRTMSINADGAFWCIRACLPDMRARGYGKVINMASIAAEQGRPATSPAYAASKGALLGLTAALSHQLGGDGICVNAISPGFIRTEIHEAFTPAQLARYEADIPLRRGGRPGAHGRVEDVAGTALYLASADGDYVTGQVIGVNGGTRTL